MRRLGMVLLAILFLFMVFAGPATQKADAVVVSTIVIGAVIAAMAAAGIGLAVTGMTSAQLQDWVSGKLNDWATSLGGTVQDYIDGNEITVSGRGFLSLGNLAATSISQFISWLQIEDSIPDNAETPIVGDVLVIKIDDDYWHPICNDGGTYWSAKRKGNYTMYAVAVNGNGAFGPLIAWEGTANNQFYIERTDHYVEPNYSSYGGILSRETYDSYGGRTFSWQRAWNWYGSSSNLKGTQVYGSTALGLTAIANAINSDDYQNTVLSYDTGTIIVPTIAQSDKWFLDVGADPGVTVDTVTDGVIADTIEGTLTVSGEVAEDEPEIEIDGPIGVSGLTEVFPFCIPFDVYALLNCLSADPQTPVFTVRFVIPGVINQEFTIDLTPFNTIAQVVRTMELLAFAIGLALVTRERFLRS